MPQGPPIVDKDYGDITVSGGGQAWAVDSGAIGYTKIQDVSAASRLLGRGSAAGAGPVEEIVLGTNLSMSGTTLNAAMGDVSDGDTLSIGLTFPNTGLHLLDTDASHDLIVAPGSNLTADRTLTVTTGDADRTLTINGNAALNQDVETTSVPQFAGIGFGTAGTSGQVKFLAGTKWVPASDSTTAAQWCNAAGTAFATFDTTNRIFSTNRFEAGNSNTRFGSSCLTSITTGVGNTGVGVRALRDTNTGINNAAFGIDACVANTSGSYNMAIGLQSMNGNTSGNFNAAIGVSSLRENTTGDENFAGGFGAGRYIADGVTANAVTDDSVYVGAATKANASGETNQTVVGYGTIGLGSNTVAIGNTSITNTRLRGNLLLNLSAAGTTAAKVMCMGDGTAPTTNPSNAAQLWVQSSRWKVMESGASARFLVQAASSSKTTAGAPYTNDGYVEMVINGTTVRVMTTA